MSDKGQQASTVQTNSITIKCYVLFQMKVLPLFNQHRLRFQRATGIKGSYILIENMFEKHLVKSRQCENVRVDTSPGAADSPPKSTVSFRRVHGQLIARKEVIEEGSVENSNQELALQGVLRGSEKAEVGHQECQSLKAIVLYV